MNTFENEYAYTEAYEDSIQNWLDVHLEDARNELGEDVCGAVQDHSDLELF